MSISLGNQVETHVAAQTRALTTLLAVNAILAMPVQQMLVRVDEELDCNPALEQQEHPCPQCGHAMSGVICARCGRSVLDGGARMRGDRPSVPASPDDEGRDPFHTVAAPASLYDHAEAALTAAVGSDDEARIGRYLVGCLDRRGYFDADVAYVAADLNVGVDDVERVLYVMQTLDPPGIGARSVQECMLIQLRTLPASPDRQLAMRIVAEHLPRVERRQLGAVAAATGVSIDDIRTALRFMREQLAPSPADRFAADHGVNGVKPSELAVPDVLVHRTADGYRIELNGADALALTINPAFKQVLVDSRLKPTLLSKDERERLRAQVGRGRLFMETIRRRNWTLYNCVEYIVRAQRAFLDAGPSHLRPLTMSAVARALDISESTVSRALDGKFVRLPNGRLTAFGVFFDNSASAKERIKALIAAEDPIRPMTDGQLTMALEQEGVGLARRTVAKYREELRLPTFQLRRGAAPAP